MQSIVREHVFEFLDFFFFLQALECQKIDIFAKFSISYIKTAISKKLNKKSKMCSLTFVKGYLLIINTKFHQNPLKNVGGDRNSNFNFTRPKNQDGRHNYDVIGQKLFFLDLINRQS